MVACNDSRLPCL